jgi:ABC-2 type transport system permease protein
LIALYALLGAGFSLSLGLLFGAVFQSSGAAATASGLVTTLYILAGIFVGPWKLWLGASPVLTLARLFPTYYLADGAYDAWQNLGSLGSHALNLGILLGSGLLLFALAAWILRGQAASAAAL